MSAKEGSFYVLYISQSSPGAHTSNSVGTSRFFSRGKAAGEEHSLLTLSGVGVENKKCCNSTFTNALLVNTGTILSFFDCNLTRLFFLFFKKSFIAPSVYTRFTKINYKIVPETNSNKYLHYGTSGNE